jgi:hypothetical protein
VPLNPGVTVEDILFNINRKEQKKKRCFICGDKGHFRDNCPSMGEPKKSRSKGKALTTIKTWDGSSSEDEHPWSHDHLLAQGVIYSFLA